MSRNPMETTRPKERRRFLRKTMIPDFLGSCLTRKIVFSACWSSRNAPLAAINTSSGFLIATLDQAAQDNGHRGAHDDRERAGLVPVRTLQNRLDGKRPIPSDQLVDLPHDLAAHRLRPEHGARDSNRDDEDR